MVRDAECPAKLLEHSNTRLPPFCLQKRDMTGINSRPLREFLLLEASYRARNFDRFPVVHVSSCSWALGHPEQYIERLPPKGPQQTFGYFSYAGINITAVCVLLSPKASRLSYRRFNFSFLLRLDVALSLQCL